MKLLVTCLLGAVLVTFLNAAAPVNTAEKIAKGVYLATTNEVVVLSLKARPEERLLLLFTRFTYDDAAFKWLYFNPLTADWVTGESQLQEVYDRIPQPDGNCVVIALPGHNPRIQAGGISLEWSICNSKSGWIYFRPDGLNFQTLPADQFGPIKK